MYLVISKFFLEMPSLNLTKNYLTRQKKKNKKDIHSSNVFLNAYSIQSNVLAPDIQR